MRAFGDVEHRFTAAALVLAAVGAIHGLVYVPFAGPRLGDTAGYTAAADAIRAGGYTTALPRVDVTGYELPPNARGAPERQTYRTPGYPLLVALTGHRAARPPALIGTQALLVGATAFLLALLGRPLFGPGAALLGAGLYALDPFTKHYVPRILSEVLAGFFVVAAAYCLVRAWRSGAARWWAASGALVAALTLTRPMFFLAIPLVVIAPLATRAKAVGVLASLAAASILLAPWIAWEHNSTGRWSVASFGEGWNLLLAAHGEGLARTSVEVSNSPDFRRDFDSVHRFAPSPNALRRDARAHPRYLARADAQQRRLARRLFVDRLEDRPLDVAGETGYRAYFLWMAREDWRQPGGLGNIGLRLVDWVTLALAAAGILVALGAGGPARALALFLLVFTAITALHHVEARYAMPVRSLYLALAAVGALALVSSVRTRRAERSPP